ncbi:MAG TPA: hypothetical protein VJH94_04990, partial [Candidatus Paceibacterota bacterium]
IPRGEGEYIFELSFGDQRITKTVRIIHYGEEIKASLQELGRRYDLNMERLTAREVIESIRKKEPAKAKGLKILLTLFEKYVYGKKDIVRSEFIEYYCGG